VAGIIVSAVGDELVVAHPSGHTDLKTLITVLGGAALFLVGNTLFRWTILGKLSLSHLVGIVVLALLIPVAEGLSPLMLTSATTLTLAAIAVWETSSKRWRPHPHGVSAGIHQEESR
jgi:low temperature requirement protein LtrA